MSDGTNLARLKKYVSSGQVRIIHVEAVPRSISTALGRSLNEIEDSSVFISEPFNRMKHDIEDAAGHVLRVIDAIPVSKGDPLVIITKSMARNLTVPIFHEWTSICDGIVWSVRDPLVQMASLVTRIANDLAYAPGIDRLAQQDLTSENIQAVNDFLEKGPVSRNFSKTSWEDIGQHFQNSYNHDHSVVIDGAELTLYPEIVLRKACEILNLRFSPQQVDGWQGDFINVNTGYNPTLTDSTHAWTREAAISRGIFSVEREPINLDQLPKPLRNHIVDVALPVYREMMDSEYAVKGSI